MHPKVLSLTLSLTYSTHIHNSSVQTHKTLQIIIKTLTATGWGKQKEALMAIYKAQDTNILYMPDKTLTLPIHEHLQLHASQYKQKTQHPSHPLHKHTTYFNSSRLNQYLRQRLLHDEHCHRSPHSYYNRHKTKHAPYSYIYCI